METLQKVELAVGVLAVLLIIFFALSPPLSPPFKEFEKEYAVDYGSVKLSKSVEINERGHKETLRLDKVVGANGIAVIFFVPKALAQTSSQVKLSTNGQISVLKDDPIIQVTITPDNSNFLVVKNFENNSVQTCTVNLIVPKKIVDSLSEQQKSNLIEVFSPLESEEFDCDRANQIENELNNKTLEFFSEAELAKKQVKKNKIFFQAVNNSLIDVWIKSLKNTTSPVSAKPITEEGLQIADQWISSLSNAVENLTKLPGETGFFKELEIEFQDKVQKGFELTPTELPKRIELSFSNKITSSYYTRKIFFPNEIDEFNEEASKEKPTAAIGGQLPQGVEINVSVEGEEYPYTLVLESEKNAEQEVPLFQELELEITWGDFPPTKSSIPLGIWKNPCKRIAEEEQGLQIFYEGLIECYESKVGISRVLYNLVFLESLENAQKELQEKSKFTRFVDPQALEEVLERFDEKGKGITTSSINNGLKAILSRPNASVARDEQELLRLPEFAKVKEKIDSASDNISIVVRALDEFETLLLLIKTVSEEAGIESEFFDAATKGKEIIRAQKTKVLAELEFKKDPFDGKKREELVNSMIELERLVRAAKAEEIEVFDEAGLRKKLVEDTEKMFGRQQDLIETLEKEIADLKAQINGLNEAIASEEPWFLYSGLIDDEEEKQDRLNKMNAKVIELERQKSDIKVVIERLKQGESLLAIRDSEEFTRSEKTRQAFKNNPTLRGEWRKRRLVIEKPFIDDLVEATAFFQTIKALELERDRLLARELFFEKEIQEIITPSKSWWEANIVKALKDYYAGITGEAELLAIREQYYYSQRLGIQRIINLLNQGHNLLEISESNKVSAGQLISLEKNQPKSIGSGIELELTETDLEQNKATLAAYFHGEKKGADVVVESGQISGFRDIPGLVVKLEGVLQSSAKLRFFYDDSWNESKSVDVALKEHDLLEIPEIQTVLYVEETSLYEIEWTSQDICGYDRIGYNLEIAKATIHFFEKITKQEAEEILYPQEGILGTIKSFFDAPDAGDLAEAANKKGGESGKLEIEKYYCYGSGGGLVDPAEPFQKHSFAFPSNPNIIIGAIDFSSTFPPDISVKVNYPELKEKLSQTSELQEDQKGETFESFLVVEDVEQNGQLLVEWRVKPYAAYYKILRNGEEIQNQRIPQSYYSTFFPEEPAFDSFIDAELEDGKSYSYEVKAFNENDEEIGATPTVFEIAGKQKLVDAAISVALSNTTLSNIVQLQEIFKKGKNPTDEQRAGFAYSIAKSYQRDGMNSEAVLAFSELIKTFPQTSFAKKAEVDVEKSAGAQRGEKISSVVASLTSVKSGAIFAATWGAGIVISGAIKGGVATYKILSSLGKAQKLASSGEVSGLLTASRFARIKEIARFALTTPFDDMIAQGITRSIVGGVVRYKNFRISRALLTAREASKELGELGVIDLVSAKNVLIAETMPVEEAFIAGRSVQVIDAGNEFLYITNGKGALAVVKDADSLAQAATSAKKFRKAIGYLEKNNLAPSGSSDSAKLIEGVLTDSFQKTKLATLQEGKFVDAEIVGVADVTSKSQAIVYIGEALGTERVAAQAVTGTLSIPKAFTGVTGSRRTLAKIIRGMNVPGIFQAQWLTLANSQTAFPVFVFKPEPTWFFDGKLVMFDDPQAAIFFQHPRADSEGITALMDHRNNQILFNIQFMKSNAPFAGISVQQQFERALMHEFSHSTLDKLPKGVRNEILTKTHQAMDQEAVGKTFELHGSEYFYRDGILDEKLLANEFLARVAEERATQGGFFTDKFEAMPLEVQTLVKENGLANIDIGHITQRLYSDPQFVELLGKSPPARRVFIMQPTREFTLAAHECLACLASFENFEADTIIINLRGKGENIVEALSEGRQFAATINRVDRTIVRVEINDGGAEVDLLQLFSAPNQTIELPAARGLTLIGEGLNEPRIESIVVRTAQDDLKGKTTIALEEPTGRVIITLDVTASDSALFYANEFELFKSSLSGLQHQPDLSEFVKLRERGFSVSDIQEVYTLLGKLHEIPEKGLQDLAYIESFSEKEITFREAFRILLDDLIQAGPETFNAKLHEVYAVIDQTSLKAETIYALDERYLTDFYFMSALRSVLPEEEIIALKKTRQANEYHFHSTPRYPRGEELTGKELSNLETMLIEGKLRPSYSASGKAEGVFTTNNLPYTTDYLGTDQLPGGILVFRRSRLEELGATPDRSVLTQYITGGDEGLPLSEAEWIIPSPASYDLLKSQYATQKAKMELEIRDAPENQGLSTEELQAKVQTAWDDFDLRTFGIRNGRIRTFDDVVVNPKNVEFKLPSQAGQRIHISQVSDEELALYGYEKITADDGGELIVPVRDDAIIPPHWDTSGDFGFGIGAAGLPESTLTVEQLVYPSFEDFYQRTGILVREGYYDPVTGNGYGIQHVKKHALEFGGENEMFDWIEFVGKQPQIIFESSAGEGKIIRVHGMEQSTYGPEKIAWLVTGKKTEYEEFITIYVLTGGKQQLFGKILTELEAGAFKAYKNPYKPLERYIILNEETGQAIKISPLPNKKQQITMTRVDVTKERLREIPREDIPTQIIDYIKGSLKNYNFSALNYSGD